MTYSTPRSVRTNCIETMKGILRKRKKVSLEALKIYIMRQYNITSQTFHRYLKDLIEIQLVKVNSGIVEWIEEETKVDL
jgi:PBP1b-binding outer membrane lipoprotein LpoB